MLHNGMGFFFCLFVLMVYLTMYFFIGVKQSIFLELILLARLAKFIRAVLKVLCVNDLTLWTAVSVARVTVIQEHLH